MTNTVESARGYIAPVSEDMTVVLGREMPTPPPPEVPDYTLGNWPDMFIRDGTWDAYTIIGADDAEPESIIALSWITGALGDYIEGPVDWVSTSKLDTDLTSYTARDSLVIGGPAVNRAAASLLGLPYPTYGVASGCPEDGAVIRVIEDEEGHGHVLVMGWDAGNLQQAAYVLANWQDYEDELVGTEVTIGGEYGTTPVFGYSPPPVGP